MLYLKRKKDQSVMIGSDIEIRIISMSDGYVTIGLQSPGNMQVLRKEVYDKITKQNLDSLSSFNDIQEA
jgi:carbon storage regulator